MQIKFSYMGFIMALAFCVLPLAYTIIVAQSYFWAAIIAVISVALSVKFNCKK